MAVPVEISKNDHPLKLSITGDTEFGSHNMAESDGPERTGRMS
jgi:hypothetical protein